MSGSFEVNWERRRSGIAATLEQSKPTFGLTAGVETVSRALNVENLHLFNVSVKDARAAGPDSRRHKGHRTVDGYHNGAIIVSTDGN